MTGYSGTPLWRKLGIDEGDTVAVLDDPGQFLDLVNPLPPGVSIRTNARGRADVVVFFTRSRSGLKRRIDTLGRMVSPDGACWVCWPKRGSDVSTDITEDTIREIALPIGLVDNKVAAIDPTWSGLRLVWRQERRVNQ